MISVLLHNGVNTESLPFSHALTYFNNRDDLVEEDEFTVAKGVGMVFGGDE